MWLSDKLCVRGLELVCKVKLFLVIIGCIVCVYLFFLDVLVCVDYVV